MYDPQSRPDICGSAEGHRALLAADRRYRHVQDELRQFARAFAAYYARTGLRSTIPIIPVVVHIILKRPERITDAVVNSQIAVLNEDFRLLNPDASLIPTRFASLAADCRIQFQLAARDPNCLPTTGINRHVTALTSFPYDRNNPTTPAGTPVKFPSEGGVAPWPRDQYLNIWVCNLGGTTQGYATFPGMPADVDGVVVDYRAFGTVGTSLVIPGRTLGRTTTHEVGHWLNLQHIWGDDETWADICLGDDHVADTPNQAGPTTDCPSPATIRLSCGNAPNGDLFMDYMDYTCDDSRIMFTAGQGTRMDAALFSTLDGGRAAILGSSALVPPSGVPAADLWCRDAPTDVGAEPDTTTSVLWDSDDIWVRRQQDGLVNQDHQNPEYRASSGDPNYVYVRVRNRGCGASASATLKLSWAKASTALGWPAPWDGSVTVPALMGSPIGAQATGAVAGGSFTILEFPWSPPDPDDYSSFGGDQSHFCLLARIETATTAPFGMTFPEGADLYANVQNNNNIAWKNVTVLEETATAEFVGVTTIANPYSTKGVFRLTVSSPESPASSPIGGFGVVVVDLPKALHARWSQAGAARSGFEPIGESCVRLVGQAGWIGGLELDAGELQTIQLRVWPHGNPGPAYRVFHLDVVQQPDTEEAEEIMGGVRFTIKTVNTATPRA